MERIEPTGVIGADIPRVDGVAKVTGAARYGADEPVEGLAWAYLATSDIAVGKVRSIDETAARALPGILEIFTHRNVGHEVAPGKPMIEGGHHASSVMPLHSDRVHYAGQTVAVVVAETFEAARAGANLLDIRYEPELPTATFDGPDAPVVKPQAMGETKIHVGHLDGAFDHAAATVDEFYETPAQHHNPLELFQATCDWDGENLTVWESSQNVTGYKHGLAHQLGLNPKHVRVLSHFVGGAFGSRGELAPTTALIAYASQQLGRPVKLVATRAQGFTLRTFRAETRHHVRLASDAEGHLTALAHEGWELTSRNDRFALAGIQATTRMYACPKIDARIHNVEADRQTPGFMRAPPEVPYMFALESAMDELATRLGIDPVELRRRNETANDPISGLPYSSRSLMPCYDAAAEAFGWSRRDPRVGSMRDGDWILGWGCATATYPAQIAPADGRVTLTPDGRAVVEIGAHDIGTGLYTILAQTAADRLGVPVDKVTVRLGDSDLPAAPVGGGSNATASNCTVIAMACEEIRARLAKAAVRPKLGRLHGAAPATLTLRDGQLVAPDGRAEPLTIAARRVGGHDAIVADATNNPDGAPMLIGPSLIRRGVGLLVPGTGHKTFIASAFGAQFVEVRVHRRTGEIRAPRLVGAFAAGRIMNPRTAKSQLMGGQIWGLSSALFESTEIDPRTARYVNDDLAEYHIPVCADVPDVTTILIPEVDTLVNPLGTKGVGELGIVGLNAAIANAVYHATGVRIRKLPLRLDDRLLAGDGLRTA